MNTPTACLTPLTCLAATVTAFAQSHAHYGAGVVDTNGNHQPDAGEPLQFVGESGTSKTYHLLARPVGQRPTQRCGGYYMLDERPRTLFPADAFSFTAISDGQFDANTAGHAHTGAYLWMEIVSVTGPAGAHFGFWEENWSASHDTPSTSFTTNQPTGNFRFLLSEGFDDATEDPFGHIHGRSWTADQPGEYYLGMRIVDLSTTGPGGGAWHTPSQVYVYHFSAGPRFQPTGKMIAGTGYVLTWPSQMGHWNGDLTQTGISFAVERTDSLSSPNWQTIGTILGTTADTVSFTDATPPTGRGFYRLRYLWATP